MNRFPAHAYCSITWFIEGPPELVEPTTDVWSGRTLPRQVFSGPRTAPVLARHTGAMRGFTLALYPQAMHVLTGMRISDHVDRFSPLDEVLDRSWQDLSKNVMRAVDDDARVAFIEGFLQPRWEACCLASKTPTAKLGEWVRVLSAHAVAATSGQSIRNVERRIKLWAGQPLSRLRRLDRAEQSFCEARDRIKAGELSWSDLAASRGFSDQAHLCREMRELVGESPSGWARKLEQDEGYWAYRIWSSISVAE